MPAQCMHAVDVRFTATPNWRERHARNGQNLTKSKKCTSDKKSHTGTLSCLPTVHNHKEQHLLCGLLENHSQTDRGLLLVIVCTHDCTTAMHGGCN